MMHDRWRGLWHSSPVRGRRGDVILRVALYGGMPLVLTLLFGAVDSLASFKRTYLEAFIIGATNVGLMDAIYHLVWPRLIRAKPGWSLRIAAHVATLVGTTAIGAIAARALLAGFGWQVAASRLWVQSVAIGSVLLTILVAIDEMRAQAWELLRRESAARVTALRAELAALQARTDPHFLFNSLNSVAALIPDEPELAESLLERLAAVFRYALEAGRRAAVPLGEELAAVRAYLAVEAARLGDRLQWRLDSDPLVGDVPVPPLVVQPLVENAIRHGVASRHGATEVAVSAARRGGELLISVEDRAIGPQAPARPAPTGSGTALRDLATRLELAYGGSASLDARPCEPDGWRATVIVPIGRRGEQRA